MLFMRPMPVKQESCFRSRREAPDSKERLIEYHDKNKRYLNFLTEFLRIELK